MGDDADARRLAAVEYLASLDDAQLVADCGVLIEMMQRISGEGRHTTSRVCVYVKRLGDVDLSVLEQIVQQSYDYVASQDGRMHRVQD